MKVKSYIGKFLILLVGFTAGWAICVADRPATGESRDKSIADNVFGANYAYGEEARRSAFNAGVEIPTNSVDCFYGICGLKPVFEFIAFTVPTREIWPCVKSISGRQQLDLRPLTWFQGPEKVGRENYRTVLFNLNGVPTAQGISWKIKDDNHADCVVDENTGRIFIIITPDN